MNRIHTISCREKDRSSNLPWFPVLCWCYFINKYKPPPSPRAPLLLPVLCRNNNNKIIIIINRRNKNDDYCTAFHGILLLDYTTNHKYIIKIIKCEGLFEASKKQTIVKMQREANVYVNQTDLLIFSLYPYSPFLH